MDTSVEQPGPTSVTALSPFPTFHPSPQSVLCLSCPHSQRSLPVGKAVLLPTPHCP